MLGRTFLAIACVTFGGCAAPAPSLQFDHRFLNRDTRICFPDEATVRHANEGPFAIAMIAHANAAGARYEVARFDLPKPLTGDKRRVLMGRVVKGLRTRPGGDRFEEGTIVVNGRVTRVLTMQLPDDRFGKWHLSFPNRSQMLQVSVVGPRAQRTDAERYFEGMGDQRCGASSSH